jgi:hypothetical protein
MKTILSFELSMPGCGSWNGRWSGASNFYAITKSFTGKRGVELAQKILAHPHYSYGWSDGWRASVEVKAVDSKQAKTIRDKSKGFCGYEWMVDSICEHQKIIA